MGFKAKILMVLRCLILFDRKNDNPIIINPLELIPYFRTKHQNQIWRFQMCILFQPYFAGWWFGICFFFHILGISSARLTNIFQRGRSTTNQFGIVGSDGVWIRLACPVASEFVAMFDLRQTSQMADCVTFLAGRVNFVQYQLL